MSDFNIWETINEEREKAYRERGHINILIAGRTGVGKSTLINSALEGNLATVGHGKPVTENTREITREGLPISIFDTRGLEMAEFRNTLEELEKFISERSKDPDEKSTSTLPGYVSRKIPAGWKMRKSSLPRCSTNMCRYSA